MGRAVLCETMLKMLKTGLHWLGELPWLWSRWAGKSTGRLAAISLGIFVYCFLLGLAGAAATGGVYLYVRDMAWLFGNVFVAGGAFALGYAPKGVERFFASLRPWLANSQEEITAMEKATLQLLFRAVWPLTILLLVVAAANGAAKDPRYSSAGLDNLYVWMNLSGSPTYAFFGGGAAAVAIFGLSAVAYRLRRFDLKPGFIVQNGKAALQPFNQLLWVVWGAYAFPAILTVAFFIGGTTNAQGLDRQQVQVITLGSLAFIAILIIPGVVLPQFLMHRWLSKQKTEEVKRIRGELQATATLPDNPEAVDVQARVLRHHHLLYELQQAQAFQPMLTDARFFIQIAGSILLAIASNILLPMLASRLTG